MADDILKSLTEMIWGESVLDMGFIKFFFTFVILFVIWKLLTSEDK